MRREGSPALSVIGAAKPKARDGSKLDYKLIDNVVCCTSLALSVCLCLCAGVHVCVCACARVCVLMYRRVRARVCVCVGCWMCERRVTSGPVSHRRSETESAGGLQGGLQAHRQRRM